MGSKSQTTDTTKTSTETTVIDRKATMQQGVQILDSLMVGADDKVVKEALAGVRQSLDTMMSGNTATVSQLKGLAETVLSYINKGQADISKFGLDALEKARMELERVQNQGQFLLSIADETVEKAMSMAEQVSRDQASANRQALEIIAETKTGEASEYAETLKTISALVMAFTLAALIIAKGK